jgi:uncharacterized protein (TIGR03435 family)
LLDAVPGNGETWFLARCFEILRNRGVVGVVSFSDPLQRETLGGEIVHMGLAMLLVKPGKPGPRLIPHEQGQPCEEAPKPTTFPEQCYSYSARPSKDGLWLTGSRATSMNQIAMFVGSFAGNSGEIGRRVVDQTGLTGLWDFTLEGAQPGAPSPQEGTAGPTALEAVRDQLGVKLKAARAAVSVIVVDHIDRPTAN